jgi:hypothetical protein
MWPFLSVGEFVDQGFRVRNLQPSLFVFVPRFTDTRVDLDGPGCNHISECTPKSFPSTFPFAHDPNPHIR